MTILGIDIGGSGIKGALVDVEKGEILQDRIRIPTPIPGNPDQVIEMIRNIADHYKWDGEIGVGFPGVVRRGIVLTAANLSDEWVGLDLASLINEATGCKTVALNDADAAGLAELRFGEGKFYKDDYVLFLTIGTGIGSAFFAKGELWPNSEFGHLQIRGKDAEHRAGDGVRRIKSLSWKKWGKRLKEVIRVYDFLMNPDVIILGGGVSKNFSKFRKYLKGINAHIIAAGLGNQAGIIGAALAAAESTIVD